MTPLISTLLDWKKEQILVKYARIRVFTDPVFSRIKTESTILEEGKRHALKVLFINFSIRKDSDLNFSVTDIDNLRREER